MADAGGFKEVHFLPDESQISVSSTGSKDAIDFRTLLSQKNWPKTCSAFRMSRQDRIGIAAALVWGMLYLCDSPWLNNTLSDEAINVVLGKPDPVMSTQILDYPFLSGTFPPLSTSVVPTPQAGAKNDETQNDQYARSQIPHMALYTLAIRLIELGMNKNLGRLRVKYEKAHGLQPLSSVDRDSAVASHYADQLHLDFGINYQNAIKRCLKFQFPDPPENSFSYVTFRRDFFDDVVAPVQALLNVSLEAGGL